MSARTAGTKKSTKSSAITFDSLGEVEEHTAAAPVVAAPATKKARAVEPVVEHHELAPAKVVPSAAVLPEPAVAAPVKASKKAKAVEPDPVVAVIASVAPSVVPSEPIVESKDDDDNSSEGAPKDPALVFGAIVRYNVKQYIKDHPLKNHEILSGDGVEYLEKALRETADDIIDFASTLLHQSKKKTFSSAEMRLALRSVPELSRDFCSSAIISAPAPPKTKESRLQSGVLRYLKFKVNGVVSADESSKFRASRDAAAVLHNALAEYAHVIVNKADTASISAGVKRLTQVHIAWARGLTIDPVPKKPRAKKTVTEAAAVAEVAAAAAATDDSGAAAGGGGAAPAETPVENKKKRKRAAAETDA